MEYLVSYLNLSVLSIAFILKAPQIVNVVRAGSTLGINFQSLLLECWVFNVLLSYPSARGYPLPGYCEFILLVIQDLILIIMVMRDRKMVNVTNLSALVVFIAFFAATALGKMPEAVLVTLISTVTPLSATSKILQLYSILKSKDAGAVSPGTWAMATYTSAARIATNLLGRKDTMLFIVALQGCTLSFALFVSASIYRRDRNKSDKTKV